MIHQYKVLPRYKDFDMMQILHNSNYQVYFEEARLDILEKNNYPYKKIEDDNMMFPLSNINIDYIKPVQFGYPETKNKVGT